MLTQCPNCQTIYQISASDLSAANAFVECGECHAQFNALDRIADDPTFNSGDEHQAESTLKEEHTNPAISLLEAQSDSDASDDLDVESTNEQDQYAQPIIEQTITAEDFQHDDAAELTDNTETELDRTIELAVLDAEEPADRNIEPIHDETQTRLSTQEHEILFTEPGQIVQSSESDDDAARETLVTQREIDLDDVPPILQEELLALQGTQQASVKWYWSVFALVLLIGLLVQGAWYFREPILSEFPQLRQPAMALCEKVACVLDDPEKMEPIQLVSRDVRTHPRYENALLVNASMVNSGAEVIEFPTVQLGLFDNTGTAIGIRQFAPQEYLDKSIDIDAGIPPGRSVHVVMELANTGERATSFEFSFH